MQACPMRTAAVLVLAILVPACHSATRQPKEAGLAQAAPENVTEAAAEGTRAPNPPPEAPPAVSERSAEPQGETLGEAPVEEALYALAETDVVFDLPESPLATADELVIMEAAPAARMRRVAQPLHLNRKAARSLPIPDPSPEEPAPGPRAGLLARGPEGGELGAFPLRHTAVTARISGPLGRTRVRQEYSNPYGEVIEAVYVFPLPAMAAVTDFVLEAGGRRIVGVVRPREEAERIYRQARARGQTASLLTQERPNLFTQSVANIEPGGEVTVELTFFESLAYEEGVFEWIFPTVVGPRYIPGEPRRAPLPQGGDGGEAGDAAPGGIAPPTDRVPDAHRITPPVLAPDETTAHYLDLEVIVEAPLPIRRLEVPSHRVTIAQEGPRRRVVRLAADDARLDRDFVLRFALAGETTELGLLAHRDGGDGTFLLHIQPPVDPADALVMPREISFLLDVSGSMSGQPLELARAVIDRALARLRPADRFNLYYFASGNGQLWPEALPGTEENRAAARRFLDTRQGGGGTEMLAGVARALAGSHDPASLQMFVFLTDGYVGNEEEILRLIREERGEARFFAFGIGSSVNRYLIDGIGEHGGGGSEVVLPRPGEVDRAARRLLAAIDAPVLVDLELDWRGLPVEEIYPRRLPDLYAGGTLELLGRYHLEPDAGPARGVLLLSGRLGARRVAYELDVELPAAETAHGVLEPVWARRKIHELSGRLLTAGEEQRPRLVQAITDLALEHHLASAYTAFVAVDASRAVGDGRPLRVLQPVELPEGVSYEGVFGGPSAGAAMAVEAWGMCLQQGVDRGVGVVHLTEQGEAARSGVRPGARLVALDRVPVRDLGHLQSLLLQASGPTVEVRFDPGGEIRLSTP